MYQQPWSAIVSRNTKGSTCLKQADEDATDGKNARLLFVVVAAGSYELPTLKDLITSAQNVASNVELPTLFFIMRQLGDILYEQRPSDLEFGKLEVCVLHLVLLHVCGSAESVYPTCS